MKRPRKDFAVKQADILDAAWELFARQGYERTGVQAIIDRLGISKGTFYHYFDSKEAVFDGVLERLCTRIVDATLAAVDAPGLTALERLDALIKVPREWKLRHLGVLSAVTEAAFEQDARWLMLHKATMRVNERLAPHLAEVIRQGVAERVFQVADAGTAARLFLAFMKTLGDVFGPDVLAIRGEPEELERLAVQMSMGLRVLEQILGAPAGTLAGGEREALARAHEGFARARAERNEAG